MLSITRSLQHRQVSRGVTKRAFIIVVVLMSFAESKAQNFLSWQYNDRYFLVGAGTGWTGYFGELNHGRVFTSGLTNASVNVEARLYKHISARFQAGIYNISGSDSNAPDSTFERQRNLSFNARNLSLSLSGVYHLLPYRQSFHKRRVYEPYVHIGIGMTKFSPKATFGESEFDLRELSTEGEKYGSWAVIIPVGVGIKARINDFIDIVAEVTYHYTFTDYLDDVSGNYASNLSGVSGLLADRRGEIEVLNEAWVTSTMRGDRSNKDTYLTADVKIQVYLPRGLFTKRKKDMVISKPSAF